MTIPPRSFFKIKKPKPGIRARTRTTLKKQTRKARKVFKRQGRSVRKGTKKALKR